MYSYILSQCLNIEKKLYVYNRVVQFIYKCNIYFSVLDSERTE